MAAAPRGDTYCDVPFEVLLSTDTSRMPLIEAPIDDHDPNHGVDDVFQLNGFVYPEERTGMSSTRLAAAARSVVTDTVDS